MKNLDSEGTTEHLDDTQIKLLDIVALTEDIPEHNLISGEVGTVVEILAEGDAFEVEFSDDNGQMYKSLSFTENQLEVLTDAKKRLDTIAHITRIKPSHNHNKTHKDS